MRQIAFMLFFFFTSSLGMMAQPYTSAEGFNLKNAEGKPDGVWRKFHTNGQIRFEGQFKDGVEFGLFRYYDDAGNLRSTLNYLGKEKAYAKHFHANGNIMAEGLLVERKKDSIWNKYNTNGKLLEKGGYLNGKKYGNWVTYFENGQISEELYFEEDMEHGPFKIYFPDGKLRQEAHYENGFLEGLATFYDAEGNKRLKGMYYRGSRDGRWIYYKELLEVEKVLEYDKGKLLNPEEHEEFLKDDSDQFRNNRKDYLEFDDLRKRINYD